MIIALKCFLRGLLDRPFPRRYRVTLRHNPWVFRRSLLRAIRTELRGTSARTLPQHADWPANLEGTTLRHQRVACGLEAQPKRFACRRRPGASSCRHENGQCATSAAAVD
jgi:hypothetical protein